MNNNEFNTKIQNCYNSVVFMKNKHGKQTRKDGELYCEHPVEVSKILTYKGYVSDNYFLTGLFHDLLEDTDTTEDEILNYGGELVLEAVKLLTKTKNYNMNDYINGIKNNEIAKIVKLADRLHNLQCLIRLDDQFREFREKYIKETEEYYLDLAKGTSFKNDIKNALDELKK